MMSPKVTNIFVFLILAALSLVIFADSMTKPLGRDEQVYCTAGVLLAQGKMIYRDFSYLSQMPYHPLLYAAMFRILNTTHFLLVARIFSCLCDVLVVVCIVGIYRRVLSSFPISAMLLGASAAVLYVFNPFVDYANGFAWNNDVVILCVVLSFWLFIAVDFKKKSKYWRIAVIAALLTLATCMRITLALVQLLFFVFLLTWRADSIKQKFKTILPFLIATVVIAIWPLWTIALAPRAFFLNLFRVSILNNEWVRQTGMFHSKLNMILLILATPNCLALIWIAIFLCGIVIWKRRELIISNAQDLLLAVLLVFTFFIIALAMPVTWEQHLATPIPFIVISFAFPLLYLRKRDSNTGPGEYFKLACVLISVSIVATIISYPVILQRVPKFFDAQSWTPVQLHQISEDIAAKTKSPKLILTLAPLYALEGRCDIYTELSSGPFVYRVADLMTASDLETIKAVGPKTLEALLEKSPPSAVILGVEFDFLEAPLFQMTVQRDTENWEEKIYENDIIVYFRR
jgi:4-amino-4-deoxy-L-arabinose transferase-like glycosyltransferase